MFTYDLPVDTRAHRHGEGGSDDAARARSSTRPACTTFRCSGLPDTIVRAKTGNGTVNGERVSWLVGALETGGRQYVFASRARSTTGALETTAGADLALRVLNGVGPNASAQSEPARGHGLVELWTQGKPAFGVYAPNENPGTARTARSAAAAGRLHARRRREARDESALRLRVPQPRGQLRRRGGEGDGRRSAQPERGQPQGAHRPHPADRQGRRRDGQGAREGGARSRRGRRHHSARARAWRRRSSRSVSSAMRRRMSGRRQIRQDARSRC